MIRTLYPNRFSWAKSYAPFQFNAGIQSTQSIESFNGIIKKSLNNASTLCDIEKAIKKRLEDESQHNKLVDLKAHYAISGLPYISSQFFTSIDAILVQFLTPLVLSWQRFQTTLKSLLNGVEISNVIELWRIRCIGGLSYRENLVILLSNGTHLCTCIETITKGIICRHFWRVILYTSYAKFHISIIPARWYKDNIMDQLDTYLKSSLVLTAIRPSTETLPLSSKAILTFQSLRQFQELKHNEVIYCATPLRNRFEIAFSDIKTNNESDEISPLQQQLISQISDPKVTKICGAPSKKRLKSFTEVLDKRVNAQETNNGEASSKA
ncbi:protein far1-related sequence 5-like [Gigaspora margarita]|uniref:Protein far1-related sequence 5-like n=1 Tax=Gigaspora margarita TaxID=4874 RepID=A0A8H4B502_GIGMA|nr:protein far1-related sequence 5-like [Gigaspora margarita]